MCALQPLDAAGRRRSPATLPAHHAGRPPRNKGMRYPADPPRVEEIVAVMRAAGGGLSGARTRGFIVVLWRTGLRISEALGLGEGDLDPGRGSLLVRRGKGGKRREGVPLNVIQRQLGHADLGVTSVYLQGIDSTEVISAVHGRRAPTMPASAGLLR